MGTAHVIAHFPEGGKRFAAAVEDHVGGVEVHAQVVPVHLLQHVQERLDGFLAGLEVQQQVLPCAVVADSFQHLHDLCEILGLPVLTDEARVQPDAGRTHLFGKVRDAPGAGHALFPGVLWN